MRKYKRLHSYRQFFVGKTYYFLDADLNLVECCIKNILFKSFFKIYAVYENNFFSTSYYDVIDIYCLGSRQQIIERLKKVSKKQALKHKVQWPLTQAHSKLFDELNL